MNENHERICCDPFVGHLHFGSRRFLTKEEVKSLKEQHKAKKIKWLEQYKEHLENELNGVKERLAEFEKA